MSKRRILCGFGAALAVFSLALYPVAAIERESSRESIHEQTASSQEEASPEPRTERDTFLWLILGGTVAGVTGMWLSLYRRGK